MENQVERAIDIASSPTSDQSLRAQAIEFVHQLRTEPSGWQVCLTLFTRTPKSSELVRHVAIEIVGSHVREQRLDGQSLSYVQNCLMEYIRQFYAEGHNIMDADSASIQNKLVQVITYLFAQLYGNGWENFFDYFFSLCSSGNGTEFDNLAGVVIYLRTLSSIHDEIADQLVPRSPEEIKRNAELKDLLRARDVSRIAVSWHAILVKWRDENDSVLIMCLGAVGRWAEWIDISFVVDQNLLKALFQLVGRTKNPQTEPTIDIVRDTAIDTLSDMVSKKMRVSDKMEMIAFLNLGDITLQLLNSPPLHDFRSTSNYDTDLAESVAKLVNVVMNDITKTLDTEPSNSPAYQKADELLQVFLPFTLRLFSDRYDEICSIVIPSLNDLLNLLRKENKTGGRWSNTQTQMLSPILNAIIAKMKHDETSSWGNEDEQTDEAEFQELRKRLQNLQQAVASVDESLYIVVVSNLVLDTFDRLAQTQGQMDWRDLDLALHEIFLFGELTPKSGSIPTKNQQRNGVVSERLAAMMTAMVESNIAAFSHPAIQLQYMEICVRYCSFFEGHNHLIPLALETFIQAVHHNHVKVRSRSWYLFHRFVKHLRAQLGNVALTVLDSISDLLIIRAELTKSSGDEDMSSEESEQSPDAVFLSQLSLFEAVGCISSTTSIPVERQVYYAQVVMSPIFIDIQKNLSPAKGGDERAVLQIHHDIMALGTLARGFSDWNPATTAAHLSPPAQQVAEAFAQAAEAILAALESLKAQIHIRTAARFAFSRLIGVLGAQILPLLPRWIAGLLSESSSKDEMATFLRLLDQVVYGFKSEIIEILDSLLGPLLQRVFNGISEPATGTDDMIELADLKREYLNFVSVVLSHNLGSVFISSTNQESFETFISAIEHFAKDIEEIQTSKLAFSVLSKICSVWGGKAVADGASKNKATNEGEALATSPTPSIPGFNQFMIKRFSPLCWAVLGSRSFNSKDPQTRLVLAEVANLQKTLLTQTGEEFTGYLRNIELKEVGFSMEQVEEYLAALQGLDTKQFKQFFLGFIQRAGA
ncbi:MAG: pre-tRNA nuclear export protein [Trizodia sp. TS-e1964]|nr:MAG: pre-tRNA nuclear export protein [Trizodia sp. TS-e1964]